MHVFFYSKKFICYKKRIVTRHADASTTSLSSTVSQRDLRIGDRVIVSSSQGSKTGVLRYIGITEFALGEWCGVELDEPIGKNDGSVNDKRSASMFEIYSLDQKFQSPNVASLINAWWIFPHFNNFLCPQEICISLYIFILICLIHFVI